MFSKTLASRLGLGVAVVAATVSLSAQMQPTPNRKTGEGEGPFDRMVIRGITVIDGTGAPPRGPMDVVVEGGVIKEVASVGFPKVPIGDRRPAKGSKEFDGTGMYLMPGFVDAHVHCGGGQAANAEYVYKLWLASGVTTVRGVPCGSMDWDLAQRELSAKNQIVAPRIFAYHRPFSGEGWDRTRPQTPETAREWVQFAAKKGVDGLKLGAHDPEIMEALLLEAKKHNLGSTAHLDQMGVGRMTALDASSARPRRDDALLRPVRVALQGHQHPALRRLDQLQRRAAPLRPGGAQLWDQASIPRGGPRSGRRSSRNESTCKLGTTFDPTLTIYSAGRDVMKHPQRRRGMTSTPCPR